MKKSGNEGITQKGVGVQYKPGVTVRSGDKVSGHGDTKMSTTTGAFSSAVDNKKA